MRPRVLPVDRIVHPPFAKVDEGAAARVALDVHSPPRRGHGLAVARHVHARGAGPLLEVHHHVDLAADIAYADVVLRRGRAPRVLEIVGVVLPESVRRESAAHLLRRAHVARGLAGLEALPVRDLAAPARPARGAHVRLLGHGAAAAGTEVVLVGRDGPCRGERCLGMLLLDLRANLALQLPVGALPAVLP